MGKTIGVILSLTDKCSPVLKNIAKNFTKTEGDAKKLAGTIAQGTKTFAKTTAQVWGATSLIAGGVAMATKKFMDYGDNIDKTSKKIGMSTKAYQQWDFIMSQNGGHVDSLAGAYKALRNNLSGYQKGAKDSIGYFKKLGVEVKDNNGNLRNQDDIFEECVKSLQKMTNATERALIGQKIFGKGFQDLAPLLDSGVGSIEKLKKEYADLGLGMSDEDIKKAVDLKDSWDKIGRTFQMVGMQLGVALLPAVKDLTNTIVKNLPAIKSGLIPCLKALGGTLGFTIKYLKETISVLAGVTVGWTAVKIAAATCGLTIKSAMISTGIGAVVVLLAELVLHWKDLCNWVNKAGRAMKNAFSIKKPSKEELTIKDGAVCKPPRHALGSTYYPGGVTSINENGDEIIDLPQGSRIYPNSLSEKMVNSSNNINVSINIQGNVIGNREYMEAVGNYLVGEIRKVMPA